MIAVDTNILVYAHRRDLPAHARSFEVVAGALTGMAPVGLCWPVIQEFLAVVTRTPSPSRRLPRTPLTKSITGFRALGP